MKRSILLILLAVLVLSCAAHAKKKKSKAPKWMENPKAVYAEQMYLSAIGEADSRQQAENMAAGNLAKIFESKVKTDETVLQRYMELTKGDESSYEEQTDVTKNVNIQAEQTLFNIQFAESYTNDMGRVFVLAYLNRMKTGEIYEEKINRNTEKINYFDKECDDSKNIMFKYAAMSAASTVSLNNEVLLEQLGIIFPTSREMLEINYNHNDIMKKTAKIAKQISFTTDIKNDDENKVTILVEELMNDLGFVLSDENLLAIQGEVTFEDTDLKREQKFVRYELQLKVIDPNGVTIVTLDEKGREGHVSYTEAQARAVRTIEKKIKKQLKKKLIAYFDGLVTK